MSLPNLEIPLAPPGLSHGRELYAAYLDEQGYNLCQLGNNAAYRWEATSKWSFWLLQHGKALLDAAHDARPPIGSRRHLARRVSELKRKQLRQGDRLREAKTERDAWRSLAGDLWSQLDGVTGEQRTPIMQMYIDEYERRAALSDPSPSDELAPAQPCPIGPDEVGG